MKHFRLKSVLAIVIILATAVAAWAYWTTTGAGAGEGSVGTITAPVADVDGTSSGSHTVSWTAATLPSNPSDEGEIEYTVERRPDAGSFAPVASGDCSGSLSAGTLSCTDTVTSSGDYFYRVTATFRSWTATSNEAGPVAVTVGGGDTTAPTVSSITRVGSSPTNAASLQWTVTFSENVTGVDTADFATATTGAVSGTSVTSVTGSGDTYTVTVGTGSGNGTLGLNLVDNDSIKDGANNELGGAGAGNGNFTGETYTIDKTAPTVQSINRVGSEVTNAASVEWTVTFNESVTGVNAGDFALVGSSNGGSITGVSGSGGTYTVTASTGGDGTLGLNLVDDDSIADGAGNKLGGTGAGNGNFTGQTYTLDKSGPGVTSINREDASPTNAGSVDWIVTFDAAVTGVDASDFDLVPGGGLGGSPAITGVAAQSGSVYKVTASTGSGSGTLGLDLDDDDSITDQLGNKLGGTGTSGAGDGSFVGQVYTIDRTKPSVLNPTTTGFQSLESNGTTPGDGTFEPGDYLKITFNEDMSGVAATGVDINWTRTGNGSVQIAIEGITNGSSTGAKEYLAGNGTKSAQSNNSTITLESSGALTNNVVVIRIGTISGDPAGAGSGTLAMVFNGGITDPAGNVPNDASSASTFKLF